MVECRPVGCRALDGIGDAGADKIGQVARAAAAPQRLPVDEPAGVSARGKEDVVDAQVAMNDRPRRGLTRQVGVEPLGDSRPEVEHVRIEPRRIAFRSEEHTSELQSLMRISYAVFCLKKKT